MLFTGIMYTKYFLITLITEGFMEGKISTVRLPEDHDRRLRVLAAATNRSRSYFIREAVKRSLDDLEDAYLAETAYEEFIKSGENPISLDEVEQRLDLED